MLYHIIVYNSIVCVNAAGIGLRDCVQVQVHVRHVVGGLLGRAVLRLGLDNGNNDKY